MKTVSLISFSSIHPTCPSSLLPSFHVIAFNYPFIIHHLIPSSSTIAQSYSSFFIPPQPASSASSSIPPSLEAFIGHYLKHITAFVSFSISMQIMAPSNPEAALDRMPVELLLITREDLDQQSMKTLTLVCKELRRKILPYYPVKVTLAGDVPQIIARMVLLMEDHPDSPAGPMSKYVR